MLLSKNEQFCPLTAGLKDVHALKKFLEDIFNRPFPSFPVPLFQNESRCEILHDLNSWSKARRRRRGVHTGYGGDLIFVPYIDKIQKF